MAKWFDAMAVWQDAAKKIEILPEEVIAIEKRINTLGVAGKIPAWGYARMIAALISDDDIKDVYDVYGTIWEWIDDQYAAEEFFDEWNAERLDNNNE